MEDEVCRTTKFETEELSWHNLFKSRHHVMIRCLFCYNSHSIVAAILVLGVVITITFSIYLNCKCLNVCAQGAVTRVD